MTQSRRVDVEEGFRCPFCSDHSDDEFVASRVFGRPICEGCETELDYFMHEPGRRDDVLIDEVERFTGRPWGEVRVLLLRDALEQWEALDRERPESFAAAYPRGIPTEDPWAFVRSQIECVRKSLEEAEAERRSLPHG